MKNFFVSAESVKGRDGGLASYQSYLTMTDHPNHQDKTISIHNLKGKDAFKNITSDVWQYEQAEGLRRSKEGLRGRYKLTSFAHSFVMSVPAKNKLNKHIRPDKKQWVNISQDVLSVIYRQLKETKDKDGLLKYPNLSKEEFLSKVFINIHEQKDGNDHLNLVVGKLLDNKVVKELTQKKMLGNIKNTFTKSLSKHCGLDVQHYRPVETNLPKKRLKTAHAAAFKRKKQIAQLFADLGEHIRTDLVLEFTNLNQAFKSGLGLEQQLGRVQHVLDVSDMFTKQQLQQSGAVGDYLDALNSEAEKRGVSKKLKISL